MNDKRKKENEALLNDIDELLKEFKELGILENPTISKYFDKLEDDIVVNSFLYDADIKYLEDSKSLLYRKITLEKTNRIVFCLRKKFKENAVSNNDMELTINTILTCLDKVNSLNIDKEDKEDVEIYVNLVDFSYSLLKYYIRIKNDEYIKNIYDRLTNNELFSSILSSLVNRDMNNVKVLDRLDAKNLMDIKSKIFEAEILSDNSYPLANLSIIEDMVKLYAEDDMFAVRHEFVSRVAKLNTNNSEAQEFLKGLDELKKDLAHCILDQDLHKREYKTYKNRTLLVSLIGGLGLSIPFYSLYHSAYEGIFAKIAIIIQGGLWTGAIYGLVESVFFKDKKLYVEQLENFKKLKAKLLIEIDEITQKLNEKVDESNLSAIMANDMINFFIDTLGYVELSEREKSMIKTANQDIGISKKLKYTINR